MKELDFVRPEYRTRVIVHGNGREMKKKRRRNLMSDFIVSFPGLGINDLHLNRVAFSIFGVNVLLVRAFDRDCSCALHLPVDARGQAIRPPSRFRPG